MTTALQTYPAPSLRGVGAASQTYVAGTGFTLHRSHGTGETALVALCLEGAHGAEVVNMAPFAAVTDTYFVGKYAEVLAAAAVEGGAVPIDLAGFGPRLVWLHVLDEDADAAVAALLAVATPDNLSRGGNP